jgi:enoyl-CoA hydratase
MRLVNHVHESAEAAFAAAIAMARQIAANAPRTVEGVKAVLNRQTDQAIAEGLDHVATWNSAFLASEDLAEAVSAFAGKRTPAFKGR